MVTKADQVLAASPPDRTDRSRQRSRITNGSSDLSDGRSAYSRLRKDTVMALVSHCGGDSEVSETMRLAIRRISGLEAELVYLESYFANERAAGREPDAAKLDLYGRLADRQRRQAETLGWQRRQRDVTHSLDGYLGTKYGYEEEQST